MRPEALEYLTCRPCKASLDLAPGASVAGDGHVVAGTLVCRIRGCRYPIKNGVPVLLTGAVAPLSSATAARFDAQWSHWRELHDYYERQFLDWISPVGAPDFAGRSVLEGGCGKGRHSALVGDLGPRALVAIDLGESAFVAFEHTRHQPNVHVAMGDLCDPPVGRVFDLAFSVGVLHHLPDPALGFARLASRVREGGRVVVWVYGRENNEWIIRFVDPLRKRVTSKLPARALRVVSVLPAVALWAAIRGVYPAAKAARPRRLPALVRRLQSPLPYADYFASLRAFPFREIHNIVFDQLVTPVSHYLPEEEVRRWFAGGFREVIIRWKDRYSWTALGVVATARPTVAAAASFDPPTSA
jgi:SAM-dependent methyltransferase